MSKKFTFDDLQPRVEMLIDTLANRGPCASGFPYNPGVSEQSLLYKGLLTMIRERQITSAESLTSFLETYKDETLFLVGRNQRYRISKLLDALDSYMMREYRKYNESGEL